MRRLQAAAKLAGILGLLLAPPLVLAAMAGNPLPAWPIDWGLVGDSLLTGTVATSTWLKVVAAAGWLAWAGLVAAVGVDLVAALSGRASKVRLAPVQALVATIVSLAGQLGAGSGWASPVAAHAAAPPAAVASYDGGTAHGEQVPDGMLVVEVVEGDSWAGFAQTAVGDAGAAQQLREANKGRDVDGRILSGDEAFVEAGWRLLVPAEMVAEPERAVPVALDPEPPPASGNDEVVVADGDSFWSIAEHTLREAHGAAPSDTETAIYWGDLVEMNLDRLEPPGDPDLIYPGQRMLLPPLDGAADEQQATAEQPPRSAEIPLPADAGSDAGGDGSLGEEDRAHNDTPSAEAAREPKGDPAGGRWQAAIDNGAEGASADAWDHPDSDDAGERTAWGVPVGLTAGAAAATLLAAGTVSLLRRRRRAALEQRPQGLRLPTPAPNVEAEVSRLEAATPPDDTLDDLVSLLCSIPEGVAAPLVTVTDGGEVTLLLADGAEVPEPPPPWAVADLAADGPIGWSARIGDRGPVRSIGLPLLVTAGRTGETNVLADFGAMGSLTVTGDDSAVRQRLRAITLEVAASRTAGPLEVVVVGDELLDTLDQVRLTDDPTAELAAAVAERDADVIAEDRVPRLLVCHEGTIAPRVPDGMGGLVAVIAGADAPDSGWVLEVAEERGWLRLPDGGRVELALPQVDPGLIDTELCRTDLDAAVPIEAGDGAGEQVVVSLPSVDEPRFVEVLLLGQVEIVRDGEMLEGLTPRTMELIAYLATHRHGITREQLEDAVWAGKAARPGSQRVKAAMAKARDALGEGPDGQLLVPRRQSATARPQLSDHVGTDLDRAFARLAAARQLPEAVRYREMTAALELVRGEPFAGLPVSWATDVVQRAITELQEAAFEAASYYRQNGEWDAAKTAIERGLLLCDPSEPLYLEWARLEVVRGRRDQVGRIWKQLRDRYADEADDVTATMTIPTAETELQFQQLLAGAGV
ncbi:LysM peptidoglycan-binding domain-containing protein [Nitriliruptor alkaliphilus]|uniref:LysM peptidoglycan-binding domain-containing protein n=1 Tax=Nitriliruptor alkaliphilus TaxID=427918 RepID=UPI0006973258|nr:LysM peptidoglycan-binding domain-containing protein [Nitriliruptor alkaliphilus]